MKSVIIDIDDRYSGALAITCVGVEDGIGRTQTNIVTSVVDLSKYSYIYVNSQGEVKKVK